MLVRSELALRLGASLRDDRYRIGRILGDPGGFGVTYLAWDSSLERRVAIKEYFPRHLATRTAADANPNPTSGSAAADFAAGLKGFLDEARRLAKLDHANIVKVHDYCEANGTGYLVMSYYEGRDLREYIHRTGDRLDWQDAVSIALPMLDGLAEVHRAGLIHRDVKPANIYLATQADGKFRPILIDFGAARWATTTHELTAILTEGFAPLEQYPGCGPQSACTDVYAAAATLYAIISGRVPASAPSRLTNQYVAHITDQVPGVPRRLGDVIEQAMSIQAEDRPQSASEFARSLRAATGALVSRVVAAPRPTPPEPLAAGLNAIADGARSVPPTVPDAATVPTTIMGPHTVRKRDPYSPKAVASVAGAVIVVGAAALIVAKATMAPAGARVPQRTGTAVADPVSGVPPAQAPGITFRRNGADPALADEASRLVRRATSSLAGGEYATAMASATSLHALSLRVGIPLAASADWKSRADSVAAVILSACPVEREMSAKRGLSPPPCPAKGW